MSLSRRALFGRGAAASANFAQLVTARGREALVAELGTLGGESESIPLPQSNEIRLTSNENPLGPPTPAMAAIRGAFASSGRYPSNTQPNMADLTAAIGDYAGCPAGNLVLGAGSGELLKKVVQVSVTPDRAFVTASPTYLQSSGVARYIGAEINAIPLTSYGKLDLEAMSDAAVGAGMVFFCNPNNPTGTVHSAADVAAFVRKIQRTSPQTVIHIDEAYHEYVTHPDYETAVPLALEMPNVFVSRTFSKCFGMAGMRVGYGIGDAAMTARMQTFSLQMNTAVPSVAGAVKALEDKNFPAVEKRRNTEARQYTIDFFEGIGHDVFDSNTNFIFVNIDRPAADFRAACREHGVGVGRNFPPMEQTHARISIGTLEEMQRACGVFQEVLA